MKPPRRKSPYYDRIAEILEKMGRSDVDPRHVEAGMRLQFSTLDHLSLGQFRSEIRLQVQVVDADPALAERLAKSYAL